MIHNFRKSLLHEREQTERADKFYRDTLKVSKIIRFNTDSEADMEMQRQDVDVMLILSGKAYRISEKFRDKDFHDLYIEVFSKYPYKKGWLQTGSPQAIIYFTPKFVYWINHKSLKVFCEEKLMPFIPDNWYEELYKSHKSIITKQICLKDEYVDVNLIQAHNCDGASWETVGISISFDILSINGVRFKQWNV